MIGSNNLNSLVVNGTTASFSGLSSGIDFQAAVDQIIAAKRIPVDSLEAKVAANIDQISSLEVMRSGLTTLRDALSSLYGKISVGGTDDIFNAKSAFLASSRTDSQTPTDASFLMGASVGPAAVAGSHTLEILQTAAAHKIGSDAFGSSSAALNITGDFSLNGTDISVLATDSLADIRDRINAASAAGVTASIASVGAGQNFLVLTSDEQGTNITLSDVSNSPAQTLGLITGAGAIKSELVAARTAQFYADGLRDSTVSFYQSGAQTAATAPVTAGGAGTAGTLEIFDSNNASLGTVAYAADDTMQTLADAINAQAAFVGAGVRAEVVRDVDGYRLKISASQEIRVADTGSAVADLGVGYEQGSDLFSASTATVAATGTLTFTDPNGGGALGTVNYTAGQTLEQIATNITSNITNVSAAVVQDGSGFRLEITGQSGQTFAIADDSTLTTELGLYDKELLVERTSNTVGDLFAGVTLTLFAAEEGTTVKLDIDQDLQAAKDKVTEFVTAYNELKVFINSQKFLDPETGEPGEEAFLIDNPSVRSIEQQLSQVLGFGANGSGLSLTQIGEIGIGFVDNATLSDPLLANTLTIDETKLDQVLLNDPDAVRDLFNFKATSSDPRVTVLSFNGQTSAGSFTLNVDYDGVSGEVLSANIGGDANGADNGTVTVSAGGVLTLTDQTAGEGLTLLFTGDADVSGITLDTTSGVGHQLFFAADNMLDPVSGLVQSELDTLTDQNTQNELRIEQMLLRLDRERETLLGKFQRMETRLAQLNTILEQVTTQSEAMFAQR